MAGAVGAGCAWAAVGGLLDAERLRLVVTRAAGAASGRRVGLVCGWLLRLESWLWGGSLGSGLSLDLYEVACSCACRICLVMEPCESAGARGWMA